ncbi:MAG: nucleotidyltransferase family protein [Spirochaetales bacterium]|nr:nucleotidyltransferase family protein [Spirochaetales bacterium]
MNESRIIIDMLCHDTWNDSLAAEMDTRLMLNLARKNLVLQLLAGYVFDHNIEQHFEDHNVRSRLKEALLLRERDRAVWTGTLQSLVPQMENSGIDVILLKGLSYEIDFPRDMGDLDLLVRPGTLRQAIDVLERNGFVYVGEERGFHKRKGEAGDWDRLLTWSNQFEFLNRETGLLIELHTDILQRDRVYRFNPDSLLDEIGGFRERAIYSEKLGCTILSVEDRLLQLCVLTAVKRAAPRNSFALRNILDIKAFILSHEIDWQIFLDRSQKTDMLLFCLYSLETALRFFPGLPLGTALDKGNEKLTVFQRRFKKIMHGAFYDLDTSRLCKSLCFELILPFAVRSRLKHKITSLLILPALFPEPWRLRHLYGLSRQSPLFVFAYFLEPFRWIRVIWRQRRTALEGF